MTDKRPFFLFNSPTDFGVVIAKRTGRPLASLADVPVAFGGAVERLDPYREQYALLVDLREARGRNEPKYEKAISEYRARLYAGFRPQVTLVRSSVGLLQVSRHARQDALDTLITASVKGAATHLGCDAEILDKVLNTLDAS